MKNNTVELQVLVNGKPVPTYGHSGRTFVEGREGTEFVLRVRNNTAGRVEAVISVDGKSVLDGDPATVESRGYILAPYGSFEIPGWRIDSSTCAKFVFSSASNSYAVKTGSPSADVGVIGMMVWSEKRAPVPVYSYSPPPAHWTNPPQPPYWTQLPYTVNDTLRSSVSADDMTRSSVTATAYNSCDLNASSCVSASDSPPSFVLGTGWGNQTGSSVTFTSFDRDSVIVQHEVYYSTADALKAIGIEMKKEAAVPGYPTAFKFCKPPPI